MTPTVKERWAYRTPAKTKTASDNISDLSTNRFSSPLKIHSAPNPDAAFFNFVKQLKEAELDVRLSKTRGDFKHARLGRALIIQATITGKGVNGLKEALAKSGWLQAQTLEQLKMSAPGRRFHVEYPKKGSLPWKVTIAFHTFNRNWTRRHKPGEKTRR